MIQPYENEEKFRIMFEFIIKPFNADISQMEDNEKEYIAR